jgi:hypothetical protein
MATARETIEQANRGEGCLGKAHPDEPVFVLRAQDIHAADLVEKWAIFVSVQTHNNKAESARAIAEAMREWPTHKQPD